MADALSKKYRAAFDERPVADVALVKPHHFLSVAQRSSYEKSLHIPNHLLYRLSQ